VLQPAVTKTRHEKRASIGHRQKKNVPKMAAERKTIEGGSLNFTNKRGPSLGKTSVVREKGPVHVNREDSFEVTVQQTDRMSGLKSVKNVNGDRQEKNMNKKANDADRTGPLERSEGKPVEDAFNASRNGAKYLSLECRGKGGNNTAPVKKETGLVRPQMEKSARAGPDP